MPRAMCCCEIALCHITVKSVCFCAITGLQLPPEPWEKLRNLSGMQVFGRDAFFFFGSPPETSVGSSGSVLFSRFKVAAEAPRLLCQ